jgi:hypothetical protein
MSSLVSYEPLVDSTTALFLSQTEKLFASRDATCSFSKWLQFYAFDVIGELTWSKPIGFIEKNEDIDGIIGFISKFLDYAGPVIVHRLSSPFKIRMTNSFLFYHR